MDSDRPPPPSAPVIQGSASRPGGLREGSLPMGSIPFTPPRALGRAPHRREPCGHREAPGNRNTDPARTPASRKVLGPLRESLGLRRPTPNKSAGQRFPQTRVRGAKQRLPQHGGHHPAARPPNTQRKPERKPTALGTSAPGQGARVPQITRIITGPDRTGRRDPRPENSHLWARATLPTLSLPRFPDCPSLELAAKPTPPTTASGTVTGAKLRPRGVTTPRYPHTHPPALTAPLDSDLQPWSQRSSPCWVIDVILGIVCGVLLFLVLVHGSESDGPSPPPREHRNTRKRSVELRRSSRSRSRRKSGALKACRECLQELEKARSLINLLGSHLERPPEQGSFRQRSRQDPSANLPKDSILPENFPISPEPRKQLEQHPQNSHMQHNWELSPKIREPPELGQHQSESPGICQAKDKHEPSQPSSLTGESSNDAQNVGPQLSPDTGKVPEDLSRGSEISLVTFQRGDSEESENDEMLWRRDSRSELLRNLDKNLQNTLKGHLGRKLGQVSKNLMSVHGPWLPVNHSYATADTHMETKNLGILNGWEPCMNASPGAFFLDTDIQKVLEAHVTKLWVKHRWGLPLKVLKPVSLLKLKRAQASPILQSPLPPSPSCVSGAYSIVKVVEFPGKPPQACPGEKVKTEDSVPTLARPLLAPSPVCEDMQGALGGTPPGADHGPAKASVTRQVEWAERGSLDLSPSSAMARNEPRGKSSSGASQDPFDRVTMLEMNLGSQSLRAKEVEETMEASMSPALQPELGTNVQTTSQNINAHLRNVEAPRTSSVSLFPRMSVLQDPGEPCLKNEVTNELKSKVKVPSKSQPQDCPTHKPLAADNLASQVHHRHFQRELPRVRLASHVLCGLKTPQRSSQGKQEPRISNVQDSWKNQRQMIVPACKRENCRRPNPREQAEGPEKLGTSHTIRKTPSAMAMGTVDSAGRKYLQLGPEKKQGPPESFFRQRMRLFFQGIFSNKQLKGQDALLNYKLNSAPAQGQGPVKSISIMDPKIPEAQTLITTVGQILEEKIAIHHGLHTTALNEHIQEPQAPVCGCFCYNRLPFYSEKGGVMSHTACSQQANSKDQNCSTREGQVRQTESLESIRFNDEPLGLSCLTSLPPKKILSSVHLCQDGPKVPGALGHHQHCPRHCLFRVGVLPGRP
ncbi:spermatogenesis-associated protein 31A1-like [Myotis yumanensis]|uniref:spermatogenesis-associated protein 31A1-like n=1 Tax=Myotis yumanensis TaxID=159337 RepID=UPI0038D43845